MNNFMTLPMGYVFDRFGTAVARLIAMCCTSAGCLLAMFLFMAACSAWHLLRTLFLMPRTRIPYPLPPNYNYG
ncbi:Solute carrier family 43 member 3 [Anas platyrhynchos]|uniref:Solute carrier family 43 member 3 n=1 Tax=Anas platyrhynchos TaxID=8839 RepID=R0J8H9_ANAPL|nr:Solute carrier family 43 member 3 [Anas platyrhynchos]